MNIVSVHNANRGRIYSFEPYKQHEDNNDESIFAKNKSVDVPIYEVKENKKNKKNDSSELRKELEKVQDKQGFLGKLWNGIKKVTGLGISSNKAEEAIEKYENGEISYEEAKETVDSYESRQESGSSLLSNVITTCAVVAGVVLAPFTGGASLALGAGIGAVTKMGVKVVDRATNNVKGDALDGKQMLKDSASGAVSGIATAATMGVGGLAGTGGKIIAKEAGKEVIKEAGKEAGKEVAKQAGRQAKGEAIKLFIKKLIRTGGKKTTKRLAFAIAK